MGSKIQVIGALLTTIEISVDSLLLILADGVPKGDQLHYKQQLERVSKKLDKLSLIINNNDAYDTLTHQLDYIRVKYSTLSI